MDDIDEARRRIAKEGVARTGSLDLSGLELAELPAELEGLSHLRSLDISGTPPRRSPLSDLEPLRALDSLQTLDCSYTEVSDLEPLRALDSLQTLDCSSTQVSDLEPLRALDSLQTLNCFSTQVSDLEPLRGLDSLQALNCSRTQVSDLEPLRALGSLQTLDCFRTQVSDLEPLRALGSLQALNCSGTQVSDLEPLRALESLQTLNCSYTQLSDLAPLRALQKLETLDCETTRVSDLTPLSGLKQLRTFNCESTQVSDLRPLAELNNLMSLNCYDTDVRDLTPLDGLESIETLDIEGSTIVIWPKEFWHKESLNVVHANGAELSGIPNEIVFSGVLENSLPAIRAHLDDLGDDPERLTDVKLIVLGNGRIGKTQIVNRLRGESFEEEADSTHGVSLVQAPIPGAESEKFNIWDFGGQDIYFGTHMLFLKSRAVFMLVWTPESDDAEIHEHGGMRFRNQPVAWWLDCIRRFGNEGAPLIVVQNQLDRDEDRGDHPALAAIRDEVKWCRSVAYSAATDEGRGALDDHLKHAAKRFNPPLIGKGRLAVMRRLQKWRDEDRARPSGEKRHRTLTFDAFRTLCEQTGGVSDPLQFLHFLHNAGQVFWRENLFQNRVILDQAWVLDAVYAVFHRENCLDFLKRHHGRFTRSDLAMLIWEKQGFSPDEQKLFLTFMESCGICFVIRDESEDVEAEYVAPDHLPEDWDPKTRRLWGQTAPDAERTFTYESLPPALMRNLIGRIGKKAGLSCDYWRNGFYGFESRTDARVLVEQDMDGRWQGEIRIQARGRRAGELVAGLEKTLLEEERKLGLTSDRPEGRQPKLEEESVEAEPAKLDFVPEPREERSYYVSYAWEDASSSLVDEFCKRAEGLGIVVQRDKDVMKIGDSIAQFMHRLARGDRVIVVLSKKYLHSPFCMYELYHIWVQARFEEDRLLKRIRIFTMDDAKIDTIPDRAAYATYWDEQCRTHVDATKDSFHLLDPEDQREISNMREFASQVAKILRVVKNTLQPRTLDQLVSYAFEKDEVKS